MAEKTDDYGKLGLRCGLEIHQQLDTAHKLFCRCKSGFSSEKPEITVTRSLRAVSGELGTVDPAAVHELRRGRIFCYDVYGKEDCLVETDSEPPHDVNREALGITIKVALLLGCDVPDELHVMRKTVIDGSNTSGFQRTLIAGLNGRIRTSFGEVGITNISLEEESAQILEKRKGAACYGLDRLGIPMIEIGTASDIKTPQEAKEVAEGIGLVLRSTGKVKRGIGTIRQDINVSIRKGERVEIKGAQELRLVPKLVENEVERQKSLVRIKEELKKRKFRKARLVPRDVSGLFRKSESRIMKGRTVFAVIIPGFSGFLKSNLTPTRTLGNEIARYVKVSAGIPGMIHSDERLDQYRLEREFEAIKKRLGAGKGDTLIILAADRETVEKTARALEERVNQLSEGVTRDVRRALPNGDTEFLRPLPGAARMYPETDVPPIRITKEDLSALRKDLPESWEKRIKRVKKSHGLSPELARQIVHSGVHEMFERLSEKYDPRLVSTTLLSTMKELEREGHDTGKITEKHLDELFGLCRSGKIAKEAVPGILRGVLKDPGKGIAGAVGKAGVKRMGAGELERITKRVLSEKKELLDHPRREKVLMGIIMKEVRGSVDGKTVMEVLQKELKKL